LETKNFLTIVREFFVLTGTFLLLEFHMDKSGGNYNAGLK